MLSVILLIRLIMISHEIFFSFLLYKKVDLNNPYEVRMVNDKIIQIERTFLVTAPDDWPLEKSNTLIKRK